MFLKLQQEKEAIVKKETAIDTAIKTVGENLLSNPLWPKGTRMVGNVVVAYGTTQYNGFRQAVLKHNGRTVTMIQSNPKKVMNADIKVMLYEIVGKVKKTGQYNSQTGNIKWF